MKSVCLLLQYLLKLSRLPPRSVWEARGGNASEDMCYESRGLCGLVCPSRTSERGDKGDCVKEGGGEEGKRVKERALGRLLCKKNATALDIEVDP